MNLDVAAIVRGDVFCAMILALLAYLALFETRLQNRSDRWVAVAVCMGLASTLFSIVSWIQCVVPRFDFWSQISAIAVAFCSYAFSLFAILSVLFFTCALVREKCPLSRWWTLVPASIVFGSVFVGGIATLCGKLFVFDEAGFPVATRLELLVPVLDGVLGLYAGALTVWQYRVLGVRQSAILILTYIIALLTVVLEVADPSFADIGYFGMSFSFTLLVVLISLRQRMQAQESEAAKAMFVASVSHDIRTPLNAILGFAALLKEGALAEADRTRALEAIESSGNLLMGLINDVLDFSKIEKGMMSIAPTPSDVAAMLDEVLGVFRTSTHGSDFKITSHVSLPPALEVDARRIRQILFNLLGNAVKFTTKGEISVRAAYEPTDDGMGTFTLSVTDTGIGIPADRQASLMQPYVQVSSRGRGGGTGLGLYICRRLAEAMDGTLTFVSEYGRGSTFTLTLPDVSVVEMPDELPASAAPDAITPAEAGSVRILVVDDTELNLKVVKSMLARLGYTDVLLARNGCEALEILKADPTVALVLTDLWMPQMDGNRLVATIRASADLARLPVFVATADVEVVNNPGAFDGVLLKPISLDKLRAILQKF